MSKKKVGALYIWMIANLNRFSCPMKLFNALNSMPNFPRWEYEWKGNHYTFRPTQYQPTKWSGKKIRLRAKIYQFHQTIKFNGVEIQQNREKPFLLPFDE